MRALTGFTFIMHPSLAYRMKKDLIVVKDLFLIILRTQGTDIGLEHVLDAYGSPTSNRDRQNMIGLARKDSGFCV